MNDQYVKPKYYLRSFAPSNVVIKNQASSNYIEGYYPAFSASGQDVWLKDYCYDGDAIIISAVGARCGKTFIAKGKWGLCANTHVLIPDSKKLDIRYINYILNNENWWEKGGTAQPFVLVNKSLNNKVYIPEKNEQTKIADLLDKKCEQIDRLIDIQQQEIEKLKEYKKSYITEKVKGWDKKDIREVAVPWIKIAPIDWEIKRGKEVLKLLNRGVTASDEVITCFRDGEVTLRRNRREEGFTFSEKEIGYQGVEIGDLVIHGMDGFAGAIGISDSRGKASPVLNICDTKEYKKYLMYYLRSMAYDNVFTALATGIRVRSCDLRWNKLANLYYCIPPIKEQEEIVAKIENISNKSNLLIEKKQQKIEKLQEYKKSLIYEYVTGKRRVI